MTSQRVIELTKVFRIRTLIQIIGFAGFYLPFLYNWVWLLAPTQTSLTYSVLIGLGTIGLLYGPWKKTTARLARLQKYDVLFSEFFEAMITDMEANDEKKGDTWLTWDIDKLVKLQNKIIQRMQSKKRSFLDERILQPKLANYSAMLYLRRVIDRDLRKINEERRQKLTEEDN